MKKKQTIWLLITTVLIFSGYLSHAENIKIIAEDDWYPYSGVIQTGFSGIAVDIVKEAFKSEGIDVEFDIMSYDRGMLLVKNGEAIGCFDAPRTGEIEKIYLWHDEPMFSGDSYFYARSDYAGSISNIDDLDGKKVGLTQGYGYGDAIDLNNKIDKEYSKTDEIILRKLIAGRVDLIILYDRVADHLIKSNNVHGKIKQVGLSESTGLYVAFSKSMPDGEKYRDIFSSGLKKIKENGVYDEIFNKWDKKLKGKSKDDK
jgi:polar amino acid transport system substrate-binding protein